MKNTENAEVAAEAAVVAAASAPSGEDARVFLAGIGMTEGDYASLSADAKEAVASVAASANTKEGLAFLRIHAGIPAPWSTKKKVAMAAAGVALVGAAAAGGYYAGRRSGIETGVKRGEAEAEAKAKAKAEAEAGAHPADERNYEAV